MDVNKALSVSRTNRGAFFYSVVLGMLFTLLLLVLLRTAWLCDDAYITLRTTDNLVHGQGLRWNVAERVQAYTHPLWMFAVSAVYFFTNESFFTLIAISILTTLCAVGIMHAGLSRSTPATLLGLVLLLFSRAFVDYSTSGLENPMTHLILAIFLSLFFREQYGVRTLFAMALLAACGMLNRMDTALFYAPPLLYIWLSLPKKKATWAIFLGVLPFLLWEVFSLFYYGFPFPNTAYAKLGTGIDAQQMLTQGLYYFLHTLQRDPSTLAVIALAILTSLFARDKRPLMVALGVLAYLCYICKIGGDFMGGRFFTAPFFVSVCLIVRLPKLHHLWCWTPLALLAILLSCSCPYVPVCSGKSFGDSTKGFKDSHGIGDERRFYYKTSGLLHWTKGTPMPTHSYAKTGREYRKMDTPFTKAHGSVGYRGYFGGPKVHIIDYYALTDPLLARLPARYAPRWRIGHFARVVPRGYEQTAGGVRNTLQDKGLAQYYDKLSVITRGPLCRWERFKAIVQMNLGRYDAWLDRDQYRFPNLKRLTYTQVSQPKPAGTRWNASGTIVLHSNGVHISLEELTHAPQIEISLDHNDQYQLLFMQGDNMLGWCNVGPKAGSGHGLAVYTVSTPATAAKMGYDAVRVFPFKAGRNARNSMGHLRLLDEM